MTCKVMFYSYLTLLSVKLNVFCIEVCYIEMCSEFCIEYIVFRMHFPYDKFVHFSGYVKCS